MKQTLLLKLMIVVSACVYRSNGFTVHFDNGSEFEGRVEIQYHTGRCLVLADKIVANGNGITNDTQFVYTCRQLGFESIQESVGGRDEAYYGGNNGTIWFAGVSCTGAESALEQRLHDGQWESTKCTLSSSNGDLFTPNNKTPQQQFCCNIDFRLLYMWLSSEDSRKIMVGDNIYSTLSAAAKIKSVRIGLSDLHVNVTIINIINNYIAIKNGSPIWVAATALAGAVAAVVGLITCLTKGFCIIIPDDLKKKMGCGRCVQESKSETSYTRLTNMSEGDTVDSADTSSSADEGHHDQGDP